MNSYELIQVLNNTKRNVFTPQDIANYTKDSLASVYVKVNRMVEKGLLHHVIKGKLALASDPLLTATQLFYPSYFSLTTALYLHHCFSQTINELYVLTSRKVPTNIIIEAIKVHFIIISPTLMYGYHREAMGNSYILIADIEKAIIDNLYLPKYSNWSDLQIALSQEFDQDLLELYAERTYSEIVIRRTGFLLETIGRATRLKPHTNTIYKLNPHRKEKGIFNKTWRLYINDLLENDSQ